MGIKDEAPRSSAVFDRRDLIEGRSLSAQVRCICTGSDSAGRRRRRGFELGVGNRRGVDDAPREGLGGGGAGRQEPAIT